MSRERERERIILFFITCVLIKPTGGYQSTVLASQQWLPWAVPQFVALGFIEALGVFMPHIQCEEHAQPSSGSELLKLNNRRMPNILWRGSVFLGVLMVYAVGPSFFFFALKGPTQHPGTITWETPVCLTFRKSPVEINGSIS